MSKSRPTIPALDEHAKAIGYVCLQWSNLEMLLNTYLLMLMDKDVSDDEGRCITANISFRDKIAMAKALSHIKAPTVGTFDAIEKTLNHIDEDVRNKRNRAVHDVLVTGGKNVGCVAS